MKKWDNIFTPPPLPLRSAWPWNIPKISQRNNLDGNESKKLWNCNSAATKGVHTANYNSHNNINKGFRKKDYCRQKMFARTPILFLISHIIWGTTLLVDGKQIVCENRAMGAWGKTREIWCWKSTSFAGKIRKGKTKREVGNQFQRKLNPVNMQFSRREKNTKNKRILNLQGKISRNRLMDGKQNIARIANAVQVTICLLVSTSVY